MSKKKQLFENVLMFTDIHFGNKGNSREFNNDAEAFVNWYCDIAVERGIKTGMFLGDWHHHRSTVNVSTLNYTISNLKKLNDTFENFYLITGNHDLFYREKREISSLPMGKHFPNIKLIDEPFIQDDVAIMPWLVEDEWKKIPSIKTKYMMGHFEIPGFKMNAMVEMPDHGGLNHTHFKHQEYVFSGHFHKRQQSNNVHYIGNAFAHNYADAWDFERGCTFLEWGGKPEYINWDDGPRYVTASLSAIANNPSKYLLPNSYVKASIDVDLSYEEVNYLKETLVDQFKIRELKLVHERSSDHAEDTNVDIKFETVDQMVAESISTIESDTFDVATLLSIYNSL